MLERYSTCVAYQLSGQKMSFQILKEAWCSYTVLSMVIYCRFTKKQLHPMSRLYRNDGKIYLASDITGSRPD
jgi:hypothetical protein